MTVIKHSGYKVPYTQVSNAIINDKRISFKAKGILIYVLSKPAEWEVRLGDLVKQSPNEKKVAIRSGIEELLLTGYAELCNDYDKNTKRLTGRYYVFYHKPLFIKGFRLFENKNKRYDKNEVLLDEKPSRKA